MARFALALVVFLAFTVYSLEVTFTEGYFAFLEVPMLGGWATQITLDLVVALSVGSFWLASDAKKHGLPAWPFLVSLPFLGSVGMLAYLVAREWKGLRAATPATA